MSTEKSRDLLCMSLKQDVQGKFFDSYCVVMGVKICHSESMSLSIEELKNVTIILFSNTRTVQIAKFPEISHLFN